MNGHQVTMLGTGLIGLFYTRTLHAQRNRDRVHVVYSRSQERADAFARENDVPLTSTDLEEAIAHPETDTVVVGLPNQLHEEVVGLCVAHGKPILCTKPLARTAAEAKRMLDAVEGAGLFAGYLEDLVYTPKTLKALQAVRAGQIGQVLWARSRETHPGPHSAWFWDAAQAGGGPIVDLGCHCIEIIRCYMGKENRPVEVMCWTDTLVHPIEAEDNAIALIRFESGAIGQFEVSWTFRGGMDLRDEVAGTEGTIWTNHFLRTGFELYTSGAAEGYVAEKAENASGWQFPVGDEVVGARLRRHVHGHVRRDRRGAAAVRDLLRRLRRQRGDRRVLPLGGDAAVGGGRARGLARRRGAADQPRAPHARRQDRDQGGADAGRPPQADPQGRVDRGLRGRRHVSRRRG